MKDLINKITTDLSNMRENLESVYLGAFFEEDDIPSYWKKIAEEIATKVSECDFKDKEPRFHYFLYVNDELVKEIGFDKIMVCPYAGFEFGPINSNYIYMPYNDKHFTIDIYNCQTYTKENIYNLVLQELYNFKRDAEWLAEGTEIYEKNMEDMKNKILECRKNIDWI